MQLLRSIMNKKNNQNTIARYNGFFNNYCKNRTRDKKIDPVLTKDHFLYLNVYGRLM